MKLIRRNLFHRCKINIHNGSADELLVEIVHGLILPVVKNLTVGDDEVVVENVRALRLKAGLEQSVAHLEGDPLMGHDNGIDLLMRHSAFARVRVGEK